MIPVTANIAVNPKDVTFTTAFRISLVALFTRSIRFVTIWTLVLKRDGIRTFLFVDCILEGPGSDSGGIGDFFFFWFCFCLVLLLLICINWNPSQMVLELEISFFCVSQFSFWFLFPVSFCCSLFLSLPFAFHVSVLCLLSLFPHPPLTLWLW